MAYTTIDDPSAHFQATIYSGTGSTASVTNGGNSDLQPDFVWIKCRNVVRDHRLLDSSRGVQKELVSNGTAAEYTEATGFTAFQSDGFQHGGANGYGASGENYVSFQWKANGGTRSTFTESGDNMGGGYQVNTTAGFSIIDYVGTGSAGYFSHGLGAAPEFIIIKNRSTTDGWRAWSHKLSGVTYRLYLHTTAAESSGWDSWTIGSSTVTLGTDGSVNRDGENHIAYLFRGIQGYSKFGGYTGNGNVDGTFIYTGFKSSFVMVKPTSATGEWAMFDTKRNAYNETNDVLRANNTAAESDSSGDNSIDILSNGFKMTGNGGWTNTNARTYIYAAFAENPFVTSGGVPCTAR